MWVIESRQTPVAGWAAALYGPLIFTDIGLEKEGVGALLAATALGLTALAADRRGAVASGAAGMAWGTGHAEGSRRAPFENSVDRLDRSPRRQKCGLIRPRGDPRVGLDGPAAPTLEPRDILIMCPDVEAFAPLIAASFGMIDERDGHPAARLRVKLADRSLRQTNPLLGLLSQLLELASCLCDTERTISPRGVLLVEQLLRDGPLYGSAPSRRLRIELVHIREVVA